MNFLCISLFFWPFVFVVFFGKICGRHFLKHNNAKNKLISAIESKNKHIYMNYAKKLNLHWFCTQNHILEPFSVRRACTKSYVTSEPYPRASQIWCQNVRETRKKKVIKCRGESFARCRVIAGNVEGGLKGPPPPQSFRVKRYLGQIHRHTRWGGGAEGLQPLPWYFPSANIQAKNS